MSTRGQWQGAATIVRFNWPFYLAAAIVLAVSLVAWLVFSPPLSWWFGAMPLAGALYFLAGSLLVSHLVYDRSDLYHWHWLERTLHGCPKERFILCHAGFDEVSESLRMRFPSSQWTLLDHFDPARMTEPSIRRARRTFPPQPGTVTASFDRWPVVNGSANAVFGLLAIHEFRSEAERTTWFLEAKRCLRPGGRIVIAEHARDLANFIAFGPGFLHFHSCASWRRAWEAAGLRSVDSFRITPWVRIFVLSP